MPSTSIRNISKHFTGTLYSLSLAVSSTAQWERRALIWPPPDQACLLYRQLSSVATQSHQSDLSSWFTCVTPGLSSPSTEQATETRGGSWGNRGPSLPTGMTEHLFQSSFCPSPPSHLSSSSFSCLVMSRRAPHRSLVLYKVSSW